jgi:homeobox-leucine zipper protein
MKRAIQSYSKFDISTAGESLHSSSSENVYSSHGMKKSRRLTMEQVRVLEKSFEQGKRLEAERKDELAGALGLHPRQIAIWFQNRRAKWKTKQLEEDFGVLKQDYESFKAHYQTIVEENKKLQAEVRKFTSFSSGCDVFIEMKFVITKCLIILTLLTFILALHD